MNTYCINLDERRDKWRQVKLECEKIGLKPIRFPGIVLPGEKNKRRGHQGCTESHLELLDGVKGEGEFMIIEDDMMILPNPLMAEAYSQLPKDWDMFYLGSTVRKKLVRHSENLFRLQHGVAAHAIIYNNQNGVAEYILNNMDTYKYDNFLAYDVQIKFNCFISYPMIATQRPGYSDILHKHTSYGEILKGYNENTGE